MRTCICSSAFWHGIKNYFHENVCNWCSLSQITSWLYTKCHIASKFLLYYCRIRVRKTDRTEREKKKIGGLICMHYAQAAWVSTMFHSININVDIRKKQCAKSASLFWAIEGERKRHKKIATITQRMRENDCRHNKWRVGFRVYVVQLGYARVRAEHEANNFHRSGFIFCFTSAAFVMFSVSIF